MVEISLQESLSEKSELDGGSDFWLYVIGSSVTLVNQNGNSFNIAFI
jgi:hypothetical protein